MKRYRNNVQRTDIDKFIGALSGRFPQGIFVTTSGYGTSALHKAAVLQLPYRERRLQVHTNKYTKKSKHIAIAFSLVTERLLE